MKVSEISQERIEDASSILKKGEEIETVIIQLDRSSRKISLSIKAKDSVQEKEAMKEYNNQSSTAKNSKLGDLLKEAKDK